MFQWGGDNGHGGVQFSLGIGVFPISFFASFFNTGGADRRNEANRQFIFYLLKFGSFTVG